MVYHWCELKL